LEKNIDKPSEMVYNVLKVRQNPRMR